MVFCWFLQRICLCVGPLRFSQSEVIGDNFVLLSVSDLILISCVLCCPVVTLFFYEYTLHATIGLLLLFLFLYFLSG